MRQRRHKAQYWVLLDFIINRIAAKLTHISIYFSPELIFCINLCHLLSMVDQAKPTHRSVLGLVWFLYNWYNNCNKAGTQSNFTGSSLIFLHYYESFPACIKIHIDWIIYGNYTEFLHWYFHSPQCVLDNIDIYCILYGLIRCLQN